MSLAAAIALLEAETQEMGLGVVSASGKPLIGAGTASWYVLRAKLAGLSMLKQMQAAGITDIRDAQAYYKHCSRIFKTPAPPPAAE